MIVEFTVTELYWAIAPYFGRCLKVVVVCHPGVFYLLQTLKVSTAPAHDIPTRIF